MKTKVLLLGLLIFSTLLISASSLWVNRTNEADTDRIQVALRAIGDQLLKQIGDSTSRVLPIKQLTPSSFQLEFRQSFSFVPDSLVKIIHHYLHIYQLTNRYRVKILDCGLTTMIYGYEMNPAITTTIPCMGREQIKACYILEINFLNEKSNNLIINYLAVFSLLITWAWLFKVWQQKPKPATLPTAYDNDFVSLGKFAFYTQQGRLQDQELSIELSEKESQLLYLFVQQLNQTISREQLMQEVWEKQGVFVGSRTLDVFVSKLRKKLQGDNRLKITNVHGKGYKLEFLNIED
ncbi:MAG: winged helix-turn-helix domain-containing protein [Microscillaceae bacterium]|jgi:hypothetical protein|nr:winged helix-turn-helix domain-containing protein [Microscillaceae bacterium]